MHGHLEEMTYACPNFQCAGSMFSYVCCAYGHACDVLITECKRGLYLLTEPLSGELPCSTSFAGKGESAFDLVE